MRGYSPSINTMHNVLDLRPYHVRHKYTPARRFLSWLGFGLMIAVVYTAVFGAVPLL